MFSLDTELAWGSTHHGSYGGHEIEFERTRYVIDRLLDMFERYGIHGTWAVVGKLMEGSGESFETNGEPSHAWRGEGDGHYWYAPDIVNKIRSCSVAQEIGSHNFTHMIMGMPGSTAENFDAELRACREVAGKQDLDLRSFVFPRNEIQHLDVLKRNGFTSYRGIAPSWTWRVPGSMGKRAARLADHFLPVAAPVVNAVDNGGVVNIPASYSYLHRTGWARYVPIAVRVRKSILTMRKAARSRGIFHLWTHPFNIASDPDGLLGGLEKIFQEYKRLHESGLIRSETMTEIAGRTQTVRIAEAAASHA